MHLVQATVRTAQAAVTALVLLVGSAAPAAAAPGQLDLSFGADGTVVTEFPDSYAGARAVALVPGGGIVAAGFVHGNDSIVSDFALALYDASGALDAAFGTGASTYRLRRQVRRCRGRCCAAGRQDRGGGHEFGLDWLRHGRCSLPQRRHSRPILRR